MRREVPKGIPAGAVERALPEGGAEWLVAGRRVAYATWHASGALEYECHHDDAGRMHGLERHGFEDGRTMYRASWVHGVQHGLQRQWDERGRLLVRSRFVRGTGLDAWFGDLRTLTESYTFRRGKLHGYKRWWTNARCVWLEEHYVDGVPHGIHREWNWSSGRLRRGFPKYFVHGEQVTRRRYLRVAKADPTLPPVRARDDRPTRMKPRVPR